MTGDMGDLSKADKAAEGFEKREKKPLENEKQRYNVLLKNVERTLYQLHDEENPDCLRYRLLDHFDANEYQKDEDKLKYEERVINSLDNLCIQLRGTKDFIDRNVEEMGPGRIGLRDGALKRMDRLPKQFEMARNKLDIFIGALYSDNGKNDPLTYWLSGGTIEPPVAEMSEYYKEKDVDAILNEDRSSIKNSDEFFKEILNMSDISEESRDQINDIKTKLNTWHLRFEITSQAASSLSTITGVQDNEYVLVTPKHMEALKKKYVGYRSDISNRVDSASMKFMDLFIEAQKRTGYKTEGLYKEVLSILPSESAVVKKIVREVGLIEIFGTSNPHKIRMLLKERLKEFQTNFDAEMEKETRYKFETEQLTRQDADIKYRSGKLNKEFEGLRKDAKRETSLNSESGNLVDTVRKEKEKYVLELLALDSSDSKHNPEEKRKLRTKIENNILNCENTIKNYEQEDSEFQNKSAAILEKQNQELMKISKKLEEEKKEVMRMAHELEKNEPLGQVLSKQFRAYLNAYPNDEIDELYGQLVYDRKIERGLKTVPEMRGAIVRACEKSDFKSAYEFYQAYDKNGGSEAAVEEYKKRAEEELLKLVHKAAEEGNLDVCKKYLTLLGKDTNDFFRADKVAEASLLANVDKAADAGELDNCEKYLTVLGKKIGDYLSADKVAAARKTALDKGKYDVAAMGYDPVTAKFIRDNLCEDSTIKKIVKPRPLPTNVTCDVKPAKTEGAEVEDALLDLDMEVELQEAEEEARKKLDEEE